MTRSDNKTCTEAEPFALRVLDDSMEPEFERGSIIIVDPTGVVRSGAYVLVEHEGAYVFRQLREEGDGYRLQPLNPRFPCVLLGDGLQAIRGVVVQRAGARRAYHKNYY